MAPPVRMAPAPALEAAAVPTSIIHGWDDELIPAPQVVDWAQARRARLLLVDDSHRLAGQVEASAEPFAALLAGLCCGFPLAAVSAGLLRNPDEYRPPPKQPASAPPAPLPPPPQPPRLPSRPTLTRP